MGIHRCGNSWICCNGDCKDCSATKITISNMTRETVAEAEYIELEAAKKALVQDYAYAAADLLDKVPKADVAKVRHGRWLLDGRCSECLENPLSTHQNYCPNCGAKMDL